MDTTALHPEAGCCNGWGYVVGEGSCPAWGWGLLWEPGLPWLFSLALSRVPAQCRILTSPRVPVTLPTPAGTCCSLTPEA